MSEDQRVARNSAEPPKDGPAGAERWADYLDWVRSDLAAKVLALSYADQRTSRVPSGWSPLELLSHVQHMEQRWFVWGFLGETVEDPWGDWDVDEPWENDGGRWSVDDDVSMDSLVEKLQAIGERTRGVLAAYPLDAVAPIGPRFSDDPPDLEWICLHVLQEYARHAGHLDIVVELSGAQD